MLSRKLGSNAIPGAAWLDSWTFLGHILFLSCQEMFGYKGMGPCAALCHRLKTKGHVFAFVRGRVLICSLPWACAPEKMASRSNRDFRRAGLSAPAPKGPHVIPGLGVDVPELRRARGLWQINRFDDALELFEKAVRLYPQNLVALIDASRALGARFEIPRAEAMLDRLMKVGAQRLDILLLAGQSYRMIFRPDRAVECFRRVLALTAELPDAYLELAILYERRHRVGEAFALVEDCLRAAPNYLEAELFKARLLRRMKDEVAAESLFRALATNTQAHPLVQAQAWAEIAQRHD